MPGFHTLRVVDKRRETPDSVSIGLAVPEALAWTFRFNAGQYLTIKHVLDGEEIKRFYSICSAPHEGALRIAIRQAANGAFSKWVNEELKPGDTLEVAPPRGDFGRRFAPDAHAAYVGFAGGSGVAPLLSLMKAALWTEPSSRFTLIYGNRSRDSAMFGAELAALANEYGERARIVHVLEEDDEAGAHFVGRLDRDGVERLLDRFPDTPQADAFFVCGPDPMIDAVEAALCVRGAPQTRIHSERFAIPR